MAHAVVQTGAMVRTQAMLTQLVFEHSLRIRVKAETSSERASSAAESVLESLGTLSVTDSSADTVQTDASKGTAVGESQSQASNNESSKKGKTKLTQPDKKVKEDSTSNGNLVGRLNNLVTTDTQTVVEGCDFMIVGTCFFRKGL